MTLDEFFAELGLGEPGQYGDFTVVINTGDISQEVAEQERGTPRNVMLDYEKCEIYITLAEEAPE